MEPVVVNALHQAVERIRENAPGDQDGDRGNGQHSEGKEPGLPLPVRHFATNGRHCEKDPQRTAGHIQDRQENQLQDPAPSSGSDTLAQGCHGERQGQSCDCPGKRIVVAEKDHQQQGRDERKHIREQRLAAARRPDGQLDAAIQNGQQRRPGGSVIEELGEAAPQPVGQAAGHAGHVGEIGARPLEQLILLLEMEVVPIPERKENKNADPGQDRHRQRCNFL